MVVTDQQPREPRSTAAPTRERPASRRVRDHSRSECDREQREAELAATASSRPVSPRRERVGARRAPGPHQHGLDQHQCRCARATAQSQIVRQRAQVEQHADADEEQTQQHVAKRPDGGLDLVPELRLAEHHAGQERTERHRQAELIAVVQPAASDTSSTVSVNSSAERPRQRRGTAAAASATDDEHDHEREQRLHHCPADRRHRCAAAPTRCRAPG